MSENSDLAQLMAQIAKEFPFTQEKYPNLDFTTPGAALASSVEHSVIHMTKTAGRLATQTEGYHHGGRMNDTVLREETAKMVVNALNLANVLGISAGELAELIPEVMR